MDDAKYKEEREKYFNGDVYCLVGNIKDYREYGENHEIRTGIKNFAPGTKVYVSTGRWGDGGYQVPVLGKPRHKNGFIECIIKSKYIGNYRVQKIYSPLLKRRMKNSEYEWWMGWPKDEIIKKGDRTEEIFQENAFNTTKEVFLKNINNISIDYDNKKRISKNLNISEEDIVEFTKRNIKESNNINRVNKNFEIINKDIKILVNAASYKIVTVKKIDG